MEGPLARTFRKRTTYVFDIWTGRDSDHVTMLDPEVVANHSVDASASVVKIIISEDDEDGVAPLLSTDKNGIATEELEGLHGLLGQGNDRVVIVCGVGNPAEIMVSGEEAEMPAGRSVISRTSADWASSSS